MSKKIIKTLQIRLRCQGDHTAVGPAPRNRVCSEGWGVHEHCALLTSPACAVHPRSASGALPPSVHRQPGLRTCCSCAGKYRKYF